MRLADKVSVITGAGSGMGRVAALRFAATAPFAPLAAGVAFAPDAAASGSPGSELRTIWRSLARSG